jgi:hypothetical protein
MKKLREKISAWWYGEYYVFDDPDIIGGIPLSPHWIARIIQSLCRYIKTYHRWIIGMILVALGLWIQWHIYTHPNHPPTLSVKDEGVRVSR